MADKRPGGQKIAKWPYPNTLDAVDNDDNDDDKNCPLLPRLSICIRPSLTSWFGKKNMGQAESAGGGRPGDVADLVESEGRQKLGSLYPR